MTPVEVQNNVMNHHRTRRNFRWAESCHPHLDVDRRVASRRLNKRLARPFHRCEKLLASRKEVSPALVDVAECVKHTDRGKI